MGACKEDCSSLGVKREIPDWETARSAFVDVLRVPELQG